MKLVGLISGGKDSIFNMLQCIAAGHEIVAVANIEPESKSELDSYMYQSVGHEVINLVSEALGLPLFQCKTKGKAVCKSKTYIATDKDEVEDLFTLLTKVKETVNIDGVSVGAILSDYQRTRVEHVCTRLGLTSFAYLWKRDQAELLQEMIDAKLNAILIKVACFGLKPEVHLGMNIKDIQPHLLNLNKKYGVNVCGEGGEYETLTLDCPLFQRFINIAESEKIILSKCDFASVGFIQVKNAQLESKHGHTFVSENKKKFIQSIVKAPDQYILDCKCEIKQNECLSQLGVSEPVQKQNFSGRILGAQCAVKCGINNSSGWCYIGNITGPTLESVLECVKENLGELHCGFENIVFINLFVRDLSQFINLNKIYSQYMPEVLPPARACVATEMPSEINFIMTVVAHKFVSSNQNLTSEAMQQKQYLEREALHIQSISHWAPANIGPYSQCIGVGGLYYVAGQIPLIPGSMELLHSCIPEQNLLALRHVRRILEAMNPNLNLSNVFQATCYVKTQEIAAKISNFWPEPHTTVTAIVVSELPKTANLEWEILACSFSKPMVEENIKSLNCCNIHLKRCLYNEPFLSSVVGKIRISNEVEEINSKSNNIKELKMVIEDCVSFLRATRKVETPLCTLKLFYRHDFTVAIHLYEIVNTLLDDNVIATVIPVVGCEESDVCITVIGMCH